MLELVARGRSNEESTPEPRVGAATVKPRISRLPAETCSRGRAQPVIAAYEAGLVRPGT
ncbi:hypothetical protein [Streptomonospora salina]|uniref:DNA-binding NarL/FixJ family response regulator n=1 Tax=Streptomonospora salina TaxID=104205 RepID=A0A841EK60_9ACTN|nr:hypothetical protein [Streptomonospora salina]MBB6000730.1 DNA-binding NarL/FixJ family response regulator [Streptomonospora salina]